MDKAVTLPSVCAHSARKRRAISYTSVQFRSGSCLHNMKLYTPTVKYEILNPSMSVNYYTTALLPTFLHKHPQSILLTGDSRLNVTIHTLRLLFLHCTLILCKGDVKRLRWSRGSVLAFGTQIRGFKPDRSRWIFQGEKKVLSTPSFGGEVNPSVPCRRFTACKKRSLNVTWESGIFRKNSSAISRPCSSTFGC